MFFPIIPPPVSSLTTSQLEFDLPKFRASTLIKIWLLLKF